MSLKFSANLNFLFTENGSTTLQRFRLARQAGFKAVETGFGADVSVEDAAAVQRETGLEVALLNISLGSTAGAEFGVAALPAHKDEFAPRLARTIQFAKALNCKKIHLLAGKVSGGVTPLHNETYERNLRYAASVLEPEGIVGVIEPICTYGVPGYYLDNYEKAVDLIRRIDSPSIRLMVDLYHLQHIRGNITHSLRDLQPLIAHVQIAQVPSRGEPNTPGELDFAYVFELLRNSEYRSWIGCEYRPQCGGTEAGLKRWLDAYGLEL